MDYTTALAGSGTIGAVLGLVFFVIKCLEKKKFKTRSGCVDFQVENEQPHSPPQAIVMHTPPPTPQRTPIPSADLSDKKNLSV